MRKKRKEAKNGKAAPTPLRVLRRRGHRRRCARQAWRKTWRRRGLPPRDTASAPVICSGPRKAKIRRVAAGRLSQRNERPRKKEVAEEKDGAAVEEGVEAEVEKEVKSEIEEAETPVEIETDTDGGTKTTDGNVGREAEIGVEIAVGIGPGTGAEVEAGIEVEIEAGIEIGVVAIEVEAEAEGGGREVAVVAEIGRETEMRESLILDHPIPLQFENSLIIRQLRQKRDSLAGWVARGKRTATRPGRGQIRVNDFGESEGKWFYDSSFAPGGRLKFVSDYSVYFIFCLTSFKRHPNEDLSGIRMAIV